MAPRSRSRSPRLLRLRRRRRGGPRGPRPQAARAVHRRHDGRFKVELWDGEQRRDVELNRAYLGLYVPPPIWTDLGGVQLRRRVGGAYLAAVRRGRLHARPRPLCGLPARARRRMTSRSSTSRRSTTRCAPSWTRGRARDRLEPLRAGARGGAVRARVRELLRRRALRRRRERDRGARARAAGARHRPGRRGDRDRAHTRVPHRGGDHAAGATPVARRRRPRTLARSIPTALEAAFTRAPAPCCRSTCTADAADMDAIRELADDAGRAGDRGRRAGARGERSRRPRRRARRRRGASASTRPRTSARWRRRRVVDRRRRPRRARARGCATTARRRSTSRSRRAQQPPRRAAGGDPAREAAAPRRWNGERARGGDAIDELLAGSAVHSRPPRAAVTSTTCTWSARRSATRCASTWPPDGIATQVHYPTPVHRPARRSATAARRRRRLMSTTERLAGEVLSLPAYPGSARTESERWHTRYARSCGRCGGEGNRFMICRDGAGRRQALRGPDLRRLPPACNRHDAQPYEKIGFPDDYREGHEPAILATSHRKLPPLAGDRGRWCSTSVPAAATCPR